MTGGLRADPVSFFYPFTGQQKMKTKTKIKERIKTNLFLSIDCFIIEPS